MRSSARPTPKPASTGATCSSSPASSPTRRREAPIAYKEPPKSATPIATQRKTIYFEPNSAKMGLDSRAVVDEIGDFMRAYENTVVDIEGNTDATGSRELNMGLSKERADSVKSYLVEKFHFPPDAHAHRSATDPIIRSPITIVPKAARKTGAPISRCIPTRPNRELATVRNPPRGRRNARG